MGKDSETKEYLVDALVGIDEYKKRYPELVFYPITSRTFILEVSSEAEQAFQEFKKEIQSVYRPSLYGLNISEALDSSEISFFHTYPLGELRGDGVLIGIVDSGIDYTNPLFQYEDNTTRIVSIWDQSIEGEGVDIYTYGKSFSEEQINQALQSENPYSIVPSRDEVGHGTFLAGVAAGNDRSGEGRYIGAAPEANLVVVKLRPAKAYLREYYLVEDTAIAYQDNDYLAGIVFLISEARRLGKPMAICTGIGGNYGGHDGGTVVERFLTEASSFEDVILVVSAGNEANLGHHYQGEITQGGSETFEVNVEPGEKGFILSIWSDAPDLLEVSVVSPLGQKIEKIPIELAKEQAFNFPLENTQITVKYIYPDLSTGDQFIDIRLQAPTPGIWQFTVYGKRVIDGTFYVWLPREGFIKNNTRFLRPNTFTTVCIPATSEKVIVMGGYNNRDNSIYASSGRGPTRNATIRPDLVAPAVGIEGPTTNGGYTRETGTSIAAAITTGGCALLLQWAVVKGNLTKMNTRVARTLLIRGATRQMSEVYPNNIIGYGRLDLRQSISEA